MSFCVCILCMKNLLVLISVALLGAGCGGKVVLEAGSGAGGAGGGSTGSGNTSSGTTTASSSSGSGGGSVKSACELVCQVLTQSGCTDAGCVGACVNESNSPSCGEIFAAWIQCGAQNLDGIANCGLPAACAAYEQKYLDCSQTPGCESQTCGVGSDGSCFCGLKCNGIAYESQCYLMPGNTSTCLCNMNGMPVGKCEGKGEACDIFSNCCAGILFGNGGP